jgi:cell division septal protein FtsQ
MKKQKSRFPVKLIVGLLIWFLLFMLALVFFWRAVTSINYFQVKEVIIPAGAKITDPSYLKGRNIWALDLKRESRILSLLNPTYEKIRMVRVFPDRLFLALEERKPLAYVKLFRFFLVDKEQMLFDPLVQGEVLDLPVITGLNNKLTSPAPGRKYNSAELALALNIISEFNSTGSLSSFKISRLDISGSAQASFFILPGLLEVRISREGLKDKLNILSNLLLHPQQEITGIKYIDLRFKEPVVKLK